MRKYIKRLVQRRDINVIEKELMETNDFIDEIIQQYQDDTAKITMIRKWYLWVLWRQIKRKIELIDARDQVLSIINDNEMP